MQDAIRLFLEAGVFLVTPTVWCVKHPNSSPPQSLGTQEAKETQGHLHAVKAQSLSSMLLFSQSLGTQGYGDTGTSPRS